MNRIFGIRHHGPGSAHRLLRALEHYQPDCLLVEGPADAEAACRFLAQPGLEPPVALLLYNPDKVEQASYYPFAHFSPEWQALRWAYQGHVPVKLMDLPATHMLALNEKGLKQGQLALEPAEADRESLAISADPLGYLARLAGYEDTERWWEIAIEQHHDDLGLFEAILALMTALRDEVGRLEDPYNLLREAYMRKVIKQAHKEGFQRVAIVCGAWHGPALSDLKKFNPATDNQLLKGLPKVKVKATWIPWTYDRLALQSGYGAGVASPAWYDLLFTYRRDAVSAWMSRVASLMRREGLDVSPAHSVEAVQLAQTLATLRGLVLPGLEELESAVMAVFCGGNTAQLDLIRRELIIGQAVGKLPPGVPGVPLHQDLLQQIKSTRLSKYWENPQVQWLKASATNPQGGIDLRDEADLQKSFLLHRLLLLGIPWGECQETPQTTLGSFKELWVMDWQPDFAIRIIEASIWGNTIEEAAAAKAAQEAINTPHLPALISLLRDVLRAGLEAPLPLLIEQLQGLAALTRDVYFLMESLPALVNVIHYGDARRTDVAALRSLLDELFPRIGVGLPGAVIHIDENVARDYFRLIRSINSAIGTLNRPDYLQQWENTMQKLATLAGAHPLLQGAATRLLFDRSSWDLPTTSRQLHFALSGAQTSLDIAYWVEGFLHGSGLLLVNHPALWQLLDEWVDSLPIDAFNEALPLLRRTFAHFSAPERQKMLQMATSGQGGGKDDVDEFFDPARTSQVMPLLQRLLT